MPAPMNINNNLNPAGEPPPYPPAMPGSPDDIARAKHRILKAMGLNPPDRPAGLHAYVWINAIDELYRQHFQLPFRREGMIEGGARRRRRSTRRRRRSTRSARRRAASRKRS
jgi:hypothetical protein